ncbi:MAG: 3-dehydroquinate synthase [Acidiferrobacteraceae bacterium]|jgi:3-dehydroquinate synthase|nr:3-dehydroquinate synthase [Acidiferrobacteraceae bacterium]|tara:strand:+ start:79630 stop:80706 length:1077 start_codon:yes stop_codon:yes gene_type:complete
MAILKVSLSDRSYPIYVGSGLLSDGELIRKYIGGSEVMIISDETVARLYLETVVGQLSRYNVVSKILPVGEEQKSLDTVASIIETMLKAPFGRSVTVIALGGGVVGDIAGFVASCFQRGVDFVQIPTTLLAQVDSSVGGKTGVNHALGKNMIGAFHQPKCVISDIDTICSLESRQLSAGLAEVIKYGLIQDPKFFDWLSDHIESLLNCEKQALTDTILKCCHIKAQIVASDEREAGERALLNLGHTFGHAIETEFAYTDWLHGEAVAVGIVMAARMSEKLGWLKNNEVTRISDLFKRANLPTMPPKKMNEEIFMRHMSRDKKVSNGRIRLVLMESLGRAKLVSDYPDEVLSSIFHTNF